ncbi:MAG: hypothetical protein K9W43_07280 [Candidatus Thorarchaeota archaeon]|nr:hypothetical protein [Candidatus Thorarchaeota archaeon]
MIRVRMDAQRRIRIPKKAKLEGKNFFLVKRGNYHILISIPDDKPELELEEPISELLQSAEEEVSYEIAMKWERTEK